MARLDMVNTGGRAFAATLGRAYDKAPKPVLLADAEGMIDDAIGAASRAAAGHHPNTWAQANKVTSWADDFRDDLRLNGWRFLAELDRRGRA